VSQAVSGDVLVTCTEGKVACLDDKGKQASAQPDRAVQKLLDADMSEVKPDGDLGSFKARWKKERQDAFVKLAPSKMKILMTRYQKLKNNFLAQYKGLVEQKELIERWKEESQTHRPRDKARIAREKNQISARLVRLEKTRVFLERLIYRVSTLARLHATAPFFPKVNAEWEAFLVQFKLDKPELLKQLAQVRQAQNLYKERNDGKKAFRFSPQNRSDVLKEIDTP
jgi:hypothetical protein